ncbi:MAG TPA: protein-L-isoaspartate carboxylmethyltransferase [Dermatophilaceae bacterium]|nr:protein-L-isoaspartate carboxylmethyltransferase [Dermatophilaceae bacterium]
MDLVVHAMQAIDRRGFLTGPTQASAERDQPLPIGHGQTNSQPTTVRNMLRLLEVREGDHILDVGAGSGWTTALLAYLTGPSGSVVGVELLADLATWGAANLDRTGQQWARIEVAQPGVLGWPDQAPYDRILVSAEAPELPTALVEQLALGGLLVAPVAGRMLRVCRAGDGPPTVTTHGHYRFVPLR